VGTTRKSFSKSSLREFAACLHWIERRKQIMDHDKIDQMFEKLQTAIDKGQFMWADGCISSWVDSHGATIPAPKATDFMLMQVQPNGAIQFKHNQTRNYVLLLPDGKLLIPANGQSFMLGYFKV
jgi:hypothetical protein